MTATDPADWPLVDTFRNLPVKKIFIIPSVIPQLGNLSSKLVRHNLRKAFKMCNVMILEMFVAKKLTSSVLW